MNIAPVSIRTLLMALIRPMPMKAPRQDDSAAASSERAEPCGEREGERNINCVPYIPYALQPSCPAPVCSRVDDEGVMRIDRIDVDVLAGVDQRIMAAGEILRQLLQLIIVNRRVTVRHALQQLLQLLQPVAVGGQQIVELELAGALELVHEIGENALDRTGLRDRETRVRPVAPDRIDIMLTAMR